MSKRILLFDIDGTLLLNGPVVHQTFLGTIAELCGATPEAMDFPFAGMTDRAIFARILEVMGHADDPSKFAEFRRLYPLRLRTIYPQATSPYLLPGVANLMAALAARDDVALGVATGNLREAAYVKLGRFELDRVFPTGGFGDEHIERWRVVQEGMEATAHHHGARLDPENTWVIGDTDKDVEAAHRVGARVLGVRSGPQAAQLAGADLVLENLSDTQSVVATLTG